MKLQRVPSGGVAVWTPAGHYLDLRGERAQIITVGKYRGRTAYLKAMPGYVIDEVFIMDAPKKLDGRFISIIMHRVYAPSKHADPHTR